MFTYKKIIKTSRVLILLVFFFNTKAQINLIPNPSFENFSTSLTSCNTYTMLTNWYEAFSAGWILSTDNAFNCLNCSDSAPLSTAGYKFPRTGNTYCGLTLRSLLPVNGYQNFSNGFNLIGVQLVNQLKLDHAYNFNLYYILSQCSNKTNNQLSVYLTRNQFLINSYGFNPLSQIWYYNNINYINPQINFDSSQYLNADTSNWQNFTGCFISNGTENYLTIGNFRDGRYNNLQDVNSNWNRPCSLSQFQGTAIFIDDLSLYDVGLYAGNAKCSNDTLLCALGSSLSIGNNIKDSAVYAWYPPTGLSCTNCPNPVASPTQSIKYVVSKSLCNIVSKDSIFISFFTPNLPLSAGNNATLCAGQSANIGASAMPYYNYNWQPAQAINCSTCALAIVNPSTATTYTLSRSLCNEIKSATVSISLKPNYTTAPNISLSNSVACLWDTLQFSCKTLPTTAFNYTWQPYGQYLQSNNNMAKALISNNNFYYYQISNQNT
ncbi:MAG: hypothetical protein JSU07_03905, partial [Bacteroidetes bacterium]|nr:hypothetical protein [Bacteroidota bacterium]